MKKTTRYTITDIARELGVTRQAIYYWIKKNWITPKRDYRNYPVFSDKDLNLIKKWHGALKMEIAPVKHTNGINPVRNLISNGVKPPANTTSAVAPLTWEEIQKTLYR